jgi:hypothetical protein
MRRVHPSSTFSFRHNEKTHPDTKNAAKLAAFFVSGFFTTPSTFPKTKNVAEMATFFIVWFPFPPLLCTSLPPRHEKRGQFGRVFRVWVLHYPIYHSEAEKRGRNGHVFRPSVFLSSSPSPRHEKHGQSPCFSSDVFRCKGGGFNTSSFPSDQGRGQSILETSVLRRLCPS